MAAPRNTSLALRGSQGIWVVDEPPSCAPNAHFQGVEGRACKVMKFSRDGSLFGYCDGASVNVHTTEDFRLVMKIDRPRTSFIEFSPKNNLIATWETYAVTKDNPQGSPNLNIWEISTGHNIRALFQKKNAHWEPQWSFDEAICGRNVNNEVHFYEKNNFESPTQKLHLQKVAHFKLTTFSPAPHHIAAYVPGSKGQPSYVRIYKYPEFGGPNAALVNKSFYKADRIEIDWNNKGTGLLLLTMSDSSSESYYGDQGLHYMGVNGDSCLVPRPKNGPVYSVEWSPKCAEFVVVYGFMPAKVTMYNTKCEPVFDFGTGARNIVYYNPQGNVLCLAGFGNLGGTMEFWDPRGKRLIGKAEARDSTFFEWAPNGKNFVTATTSPRLRVGNGFKFWDFTGQLLYEENIQAGEELYNVTWQDAPPGGFPEPRLPSVGAQKAQAAQQDAAKPAAYVPPNMRDRQQAVASTPRFRQEYEPASNVKQTQQAPEQMSKAALKNKKKREAKARAKVAEATASQGEAFVPDNTPPVLHPQPTQTNSSNPEIEKRLRNLNKKLRQIQLLREQQDAGKVLEANQLEKLETEDSLYKEISQLQL